MKEKRRRRIRIKKISLKNLQSLERQKKKQKGKVTRRQIEDITSPLFLNSFPA
jgi:hypothetical protein